MKIGILDFPSSRVVLLETELTKTEEIEKLLEEKGFRLKDIEWIASKNLEVVNE